MQRPAHVFKHDKHWEGTANGALGWVSRTLRYRCTCRRISENALGTTCVIEQGSRIRNRETQKQTVTAEALPMWPAAPEPGGSFEDVPRLRGGSQGYSLLPSTDPALDGGCLQEWGIYLWMGQHPSVEGRAWRGTQLGAISCQNSQQVGGTNLLLVKEQPWWYTTASPARKAINWGNVPNQRD